MKILLNPRFVKKVKRYKNALKPFMAVDFESQLKDIEDYPQQITHRLGDTNFYRKIIKSDYFHFEVAYEYIEEKKRLIVWDIVKK